MKEKARKFLEKFGSSYGMLTVLAGLCLFFSLCTYHEESPNGANGAERLASKLAVMTSGNASLIVVSSKAGEGAEFAKVLVAALAKSGIVPDAILQGDPPSVRADLEKISGNGKKISLIATTPECKNWAIWEALKKSSPAFELTKVEAPESVRRSTFLSPSNLQNIADQTAVIAIMAAGMTLVIITGGIDLSVGSLLALSAVAAALLIQKAGGEKASGIAMFGGCVLAILLCGGVGGLMGWLTARFKAPPFIVTLAGMQIASGLAFSVAKGQSIYDIPASFTWLGRGATLFGTPNAVVLMGFVYLIFHLFMTHSAMGRAIYAVGGNMAAARLSGLNVSKTLIFVYVVSGLMAGIGGVITASQLKAGAPIYGVSYEMYVIAAVVVGGASLKGGEGRILGTLIGAFVIAVIRNGMNLMDVEPYTQKILLGLVILGAVMIDIYRKRKKSTET